jgi:hypothetical protein
MGPSFNDKISRNVNIGFGSFFRCMWFIISRRKIFRIELLQSLSSKCFCLFDYINCILLIALSYLNMSSRHKNSKQIFGHVIR